MFDHGKNTKKASGVLSYYILRMPWLNGLRVAKFRECNRSLHEFPRTDHHQILVRQSLKAAIDAESNVEIQKLAIDSGWYQLRIINVLHDIGKVCKRRRCIYFRLIENHKIHRMVTCQSMLLMVKKANFFDSILTVDEKWIAFHNTHRGLNWLGSDQVTQKNPKSEKFVKKVMMCITWYTQGIVHHEILESARWLIETCTVSSSSQSRAYQEWLRFDKESTW